MNSSRIIIVALLFAFSAISYFDRTIMAAAEGLPVIPHAGQAHNYHLVMSHFNSPMAEYFPAPDQGGVLDDDTLFYELFEGEPRAKDGYVTLSTAPGLGLELKEDRIRQWRIAG